jgi:uncharacterized protein YodC (DUF2158 family)
MSNIKIGDTVCLKSGGLVMTVQDISQFDDTGEIENKATCAWFDGTKSLSKDFNVKTLKLKPEEYEK